MFKTDRTNAFTLVLTADEEGRLRLNEIEIGTKTDLSELRKRSRTIFSDREQSGIAAKEVILDVRRTFSNDDVRPIVEALEDVGVESIVLIDPDIQFRTTEKSLGDKLKERKPNEKKQDSLANGSTYPRYFGVERSQQRVHTRRLGN